MANANQVIVNGETILDLRSDTVTPATLQKGSTAHDKSGTKITGTLEVPATEEQTVELSMLSGNQIIQPTSGKVMRKVTVQKPGTLLPENIKKDVVIGGVVGTLEGGGSSTSETWVLNNIVDTSKKFTYSVSFVSNGITYSSISVSGRPAPGVGGMSYDLNYGGTTILSGDAGGTFGLVGGEKQIYRKLIFSTPPTGDLLTWLQANGVKQPANLAVQPSKDVTITSNGTTEITPDAPYDVMEKANVTVDVASGIITWYSPVIV